MPLPVSCFPRSLLDIRPCLVLSRRVFVFYAAVVFVSLCSSLVSLLSKVRPCPQSTGSSSISVSGSDHHRPSVLPSRRPTIVPFHPSAPCILFFFESKFF